MGESLDGLEENGEPVLIGKGRKVRAVSIAPAQFEKRFLDYQVEERIVADVRRMGPPPDRRGGCLVRPGRGTARRVFSGNALECDGN